MSDYTKIEGSGNNGDFVLQSQGTAVAEGFRNVSQYWYPKTTDYDAGFEAMEKDRTSREDLICTAAAMMPIVDQNGKFAFAYPDGREFVLDDWSVTQYAAKMGIPVTVFNWLTEPTMKPNGQVKVKRDDFDARLLVACVKNGLRHVPKDKKFRFRTYDNKVIRAVLSKEYAIVDNRWYLEVIRELIPGGRLSHWRGDADTMYGNVLIPDSIRQETDSEYGGMVSIGNCEIGRRRLSQTPSVFRAICMNGCIWDQTKGKNIRQVHRGKIVADLLTLKKQIAENIHYQIPLMSKGIDRILASQEWTVDNIKPFIAEVAISWGLKPAEARTVVEQYLKFESAHRNVFGVVNAMTRASQTFDNKRWVEVDTFAGEIIGGSKNSFERMLGRANNLSTESVDAAFGLAV